VQIEIGMQHPALKCQVPENKLLLAAAPQKDEAQEKTNPDSFILEQ